MILFHYVVQIGNDSAVTPSTESTLLLQFVNSLGLVRSIRALQLLQYSGP
jgi:hypothetical protein